MKQRHRWLIGVLVAVALAALVLIVPGEEGALAQGDIIYVDADAEGANSGDSWEDAYTDLQLALGQAEYGDQIWVAEGTYKPTSGTDRTISFQMVYRVAIYGGFAGGETELGQRDWVTHVTILSGDLAGDDGPDFDNNDENSYHVFYHPDGTNLDGSAILDGFTITGGNADGYNPHFDGGGMYNSGSSPTVTNCTFEGNSASDNGGGMHNDSSYLTVTNCTFEDNSAGYYGGAMHNGLWSQPTVTNCTFEGNSAIHGGGMSNSSSYPTVTNCTFEGNSADGYGGGMSNFGSGASPTLTNCTFVGNSADVNGGGMSIAGGSPTVTNCTFEGNSAAGNGGGVYIEDNSSTEMTNCTIAGNSADDNGGGMYIYYSHPTLTNCTFEGNSAGIQGGGMHNAFYSSPTLINSILWGDTPDEVYSSDSTPAVTYSDIHGGYTGEGNINEDPLFVDAPGGDYHLGLDSPCIDVGNNEAPELPSLDFERQPRIVDGDHDGTATVDMGVDEVFLVAAYVYLPLVLRGY